VTVRTRPAPTAAAAKTSRYAKPRRGRRGTGRTLGSRVATRGSLETAHLERAGPARVSHCQELSFRAPGPVETAAPVWGQGRHSRARPPDVVSGYCEELIFLPRVPPRRAGIPEAAILRRQPTRFRLFDFSGHRGRRAERGPLATQRIGDAGSQRDCGKRRWSAVGRAAPRDAACRDRKQIGPLAE
jgi:hypothetical protein